MSCDNTGVYLMQIIFMGVKYVFKIKLFQFLSHFVRLLLLSIVRQQTLFGPFYVFNVLMR